MDSRSRLTGLLRGEASLREPHPLSFPDIGLHWTVKGDFGVELCLLVGKKGLLGEWQTLFFLGWVSKKDY